MSTGATLEIEGVDLKEFLAPMKERRDSLLRAETQLEDQKRSLRSERLKIEKMLKDAGLMERETKKGGTRSRSVEAIAPRSDLPRTKRGIENLETIEGAIKDFNGEPFQIKMLEEATGITRSGCESAIGYMRGQDKIRLLGNRPQIGRTAPGGRSAATYQEIS